VKKIVAPCALAGLLAIPCLAIAQGNTFRAEAELFYYRVSGDDSRTRGIGVQGNYYFSALPAEPTDYPLEAAAFVERTASVGAIYTRTSPETDGFQRENGSSYGVAGVFRRPDTPFYLDASYTRSEPGRARSSSGAEFESETDSYRLSVGGYVATRTLLTLELGRSETEATTSGAIIFRNSTTTSIGVRGVHLAKLAGDSHLALAVDLTRTERKPDGSPEEANNSFLASATYYPTTRLGLTAGYGYESGDDRLLEGSTYLAGVSWFVTPRVRLSFDLQKFDGKEQGLDFDTIFLGAMLRF
jgi:hypothetical protein